MTLFIRNLLIPTLGLLAALTLQPTTAAAAILDELRGLVSQANNLDSQLKTISLSTDSICAPLVAANQQAREMIDSINLVDQSLAAPIQIDDEMMTAFDELFYASASLANEEVRLSGDLTALSSTTNAITLKDGIVAMLQLSEDIGTMADRIGEMADKILIMSDNIGSMADRILLTQEIQNQNILISQQSILQTQTNILSLVAVVESSSNDLDLNTLIAQGETLAAQMAAVILNPFTMATQLRNVAEDVNTFLAEIKTTSDVINQQATTGTMTINATTLTSLANLSIMLTSLGTAMDGYVLAIEGLQAMTSSRTLEDALGSMLQLSADIGVMANRILEMADLILEMADNIGMMADQIIATQELQSVNVAATQASILAAQDLAISLIAARNL